MGAMASLKLGGIDGYDLEYERPDIEHEQSSEGFGSDVINSRREHTHKFAIVVPVATYLANGNRHWVAVNIQLTVFSACGIAVSHHFSKRISSAMRHL